MTPKRVSARLRSGLARSEDTAEAGLEIRDERIVTKRVVASLLRLSDKAIRTAKDKAVVAELIAARGAVFEISKQLGLSESQSDPQEDTRSTK